MTLTCLVLCYLLSSLWTSGSRSRVILSTLPCMPKTFVNAGIHFGCCSWRWGVLLASGGWRARMLLNIPQCIRWPPKQGITWPKLSVLLRLRNPSLEDKLHKNRGCVAFAHYSISCAQHGTWHRVGRENSFPPFIKGISFLGNRNYTVAKSGQTFT